MSDQANNDSKYRLKFYKYKMKYYHAMCHSQRTKPIRINITEQLSSPVDIFIDDRFHDDDSSIVSDTSTEEGDLFDPTTDDSDEDVLVPLRSLSMSGSSDTGGDTSTLF